MNIKTEKDVRGLSALQINMFLSDIAKNEKLQADLRTANQVIKVMKKHLSDYRIMMKILQQK